MRTFLFLLLPLLLAIVGVVWPLWDARRSASERERALGIRMTIFSWLIGLLLFGSLLLLPNKSRVLMMVPIFFTAVVVGRVWRRARLRTRGEASRPKMKRVN